MCQGAATAPVRIPIRSAEEDDRRHVEVRLAGPDPVGVGRLFDRASPRTRFAASPLLDGQGLFGETVPAAQEVDILGVSPEMSGIRHGERSRAGGRLVAHEAPDRRHGRGRIPRSCVRGGSDVHRSGGVPATAPATACRSPTCSSRSRATRRLDAQYPDRRRAADLGLRRRLGDAEQPHQCDRPTACERWAVRHSTTSSTSIRADYAAGWPRHVGSATRPRSRCSTTIARSRRCARAICGRVREFQTRDREELARCAGAWVNLGCAVFAARRCRTRGGRVPGGRSTSDRSNKTGDDSSLAQLYDRLGDAGQRRTVSDARPALRRHQPVSPLRAGAQTRIRRPTTPMHSRRSEHAITLKSERPRAVFPGRVDPLRRQPRGARESFGAAERYSTDAALKQRYAARGAFSSGYGRTRLWHRDRRFAMEVVPTGGRSECRSIS